MKLKEKVIVAIVALGILFGGGIVGAAEKDIPEQPVLNTKANTLTYGGITLPHEVSRMSGSVWENGTDTYIKAVVYGIKNTPYGITALYIYEGVAFSYLIYLEGMDDLYILDTDCDGVYEEQTGDLETMIVTVPQCFEDLDRKGA